MAPSRIFGLDLMRALAIACVLHAHTARIVLSQAQTDIALNYFGYIGVEIFFVLSGFLIGTILLKIAQDERQNPLRQTVMFWTRRWLRTLPNYYLAFLIYVFWILQVTKLNILRFPDYQRFLWFGENLFKKPPALYTIAWSLAIEEWFYLLFPLFALAAGLIFRRRTIHAIGAAAAFFTLACLIARMSVAGLPSFNWPEQYRKLVPLHLDGIAIGVLFAYLKFALPGFWAKAKWPALGLGLLGLSLLSWMFFANNMFRGPSGTWFAKTCFFICWSLAVGLTLPAFAAWRSIRFKLLHRFTSHIANISYSLYLYHMIVLLILNHHFKEDFYGWWPWSLALVTSFMVSTVVYYVVERPILKLRDRIGKASDRVTVVEKI